MDVVLIAGLWLDASVWEEVADELRRLGHNPLPVSLPGQRAGQGDGASSVTLDDQVAAVLAAVDAATAPVVVVGHSAAATLAWIAADARPDTVAQVVFIGGFPSADGEAYAEYFPVVDGAMPFPGWEPFEGPDSADLDEDAKARLADGAIPVPTGVSSGVVQLRDERRFDVPAVLVCPEFDPGQARAWIDAGDLPELARSHRLDLVDIDSGHWPMLTRPLELARLLAEIPAVQPHTAG